MSSASRSVLFSAEDCSSQNNSVFELSKTYFYCKRSMHYMLTTSKRISSYLRMWRLTCLNTICSRRNISEKLSTHGRFRLFKYAMQSSTPRPGDPTGKLSIVPAAHVHPGPPVLSLCIPHGVVGNYCRCCMWGGIQALWGV